MTNIQRMNNDISTIDRRETEDILVRDSRMRNDELTFERRSKADQIVEEKRLRNDIKTADRREEKDLNVSGVLGIFLLIMAVFTFGALFIFI